MWPNTPHFVLTPEAAICHGGHFYTMSTIQDTIFTMYHMFTLSNFITNVKHSHASHVLFWRLIVHCHHVLIQEGRDPWLSNKWLDLHVPDISTLPGALDLFLICVIAELGGLLNPTAYHKWHRDDRTLEQDHLAEIHTWGLARELLDYWQSWYMFLKVADKVNVDGTDIY
jgi:hypothetical protein